MARPKLLDLYSGGGGAAVGYHRAGFDVVGVDINKQGNYPYEFHQGDALEYLAAHGGEFDAIHASPPCQAYTRKAADWGRKRNHWIEHPDLVGPTRDLLDTLGVPYVIENVPGAPIRHDLMLCGTMVGLTIRKHRYFESNIPLAPAPRPCSDHSECYNPWQGKGRSADKLREAMGINWLPISGGASRKVGYTGDLFNAIPPAYTEHVGRSLLIAQAIARSKREIRHDIASGRVPATVATFGALHDYVDANEYGGLCDGWPCDADGALDVDAANAVQDGVHAWIVEGGHTK